MPYIIVKCDATELDTGSTFFGDKTTEASVVHDVGRTWYANAGQYMVHQPVCWVLNKLEEHGYVAGQPVLHQNKLVWVTYRPLRIIRNSINNKAR